MPINEQSVPFPDANDDLWEPSEYMKNWDKLDQPKGQTIGNVKIDKYAGWASMYKDSRAGAEGSASSVDKVGPSGHPDPERMQSGKKQRTNAKLYENKTFRQFNQEVAAESAKVVSHKEASQGLDRGL